MFDSQNNNRGGYNVGSLYYYVGSRLQVEWYVFRLSDLDVSPISWNHAQLAKRDGPTCCKQYFLLRYFCIIILVNSWSSSSRTHDTIFFLYLNIWRVKCTVCALSPWQDAVLTKMLLEGLCGCSQLISSDDILYVTVFAYNRVVVLLPVLLEKFGIFSALEISSVVRHIFKTAHFIKLQACMLGVKIIWC